MSTPKFTGLARAALGLVLLSAPLQATEPDPIAEPSLILRIYDWGAAGRRLLARTEVPLERGAGRLRLSQEDIEPSPLSEVELFFHRVPGGPASVVLGGIGRVDTPPLALEDGEHALRVEPRPEGGPLKLSASPAPERLDVPAPGTWEIEVLDPGT